MLFWRVVFRRMRPVKRWEDGMEEIARAEAEHRADDEQFWQTAPQLCGDWPDELAAWLGL